MVSVPSRAKPRFWLYVKHAACHWLVNFNLALAQTALPKQQWRIITSDAHSTVWDGAETLFEFNHQALGVDPDECFTMANQFHLPIGARCRSISRPTTRQKK